ncbi:MAG: MerR family transcriptional regulator [Eubacteriales bacterium]|nr:MerR family transcriptional regulator [Eubacteriales bacterium]
MNKDKKYYTAGEIAGLTGVSTRTIRFYDKKGLLAPSGYTESGYRLYDKEAFAVLQQILMFKYLGFSLEQIRTMLQSENQDRVKMKEHLCRQEKLLQQKRRQLDALIETVNFAQECNEEDRWDSMLKLLSLLTEEEKMAEQYRTDDNLNRRIRIHSYNTNPYSWMEWVYDHLDLKEGDKILEIGCGNGLLWRDNIHRLPEGVSLFLTDYSEGMLAQAKKTLEPYEEELRARKIAVHFEVADANQLHIKEKEFDKIIADHMLYHVENREACLKTVRGLLKTDGTFCCTTVGLHHMKELHDLVTEFDGTIEMPLDRITNRFCLQNGAEQLQKFFREICREDYPCDLLVEDADAVYDYVYSYPGNAALILDRKGERFKKLIRDKMKPDGVFLIHKETGIFVCRR